MSDNLLNTMLLVEIVFFKDVVDVRQSFEHNVVSGDCVFKDVRQCFEIIVMIRIIISLAQKSLQVFLVCR